MSVLTPSIPERSDFLREAKASVKSQTFRSYEHLISIDTEYQGCAPTVNALADRASGEWLFILADDDLMLPGCLQAHMKVSEDADIVYGPPLVWGEDGAQFCAQVPNIPSASLIRADLWRRFGGYGNHLMTCEDRDFYERAYNQQAIFVRVEDTPTWVYRFHGKNKSRC